MLRVEKLIEESLELWKCSEYCQSYSYLDRFQLSEVRVHLPKTFFEKLFSLLECALDKIECSDVSNRNVAIQIIICCIRILKNCFYESPINQNTVCSSDEYLKLLFHLVLWSSDLLHMPISDEAGVSIFRNIPSNTSLCEEKQSLAEGCLMCLANLMAGNSNSRQQVWLHLKTVQMQLLYSPYDELSHLSAALLHHALLENELCDIFLQDAKIPALLSRLSELYLQETKYSCFVLFCLKILLSKKDALEASWDVLSAKQKLVTLDIFISVLQQSKNGEKPFLDAICFLTTLFKKEADKVLCSHKKVLPDLNPQIASRNLNVLCLAASLDQFSSVMQDDKSLLISSIYLLRGISDIGDEGPNLFSRLPELPEGETALTSEQDPAYGFKYDLIRLIAALVHKHKGNQDEVREMNGILLLLENSQFDARNPFIKEATVFALRNLLDNNYDNQLVIKNLQLLGTASNLTLDQLGMTAVIHEGKVKLEQKP